MYMVVLHGQVNVSVSIAFIDCIVLVFDQVKVGLLQKVRVWVRELGALC